MSLPEGLGSVGGRVHQDPHVLAAGALCSHAPGRQSSQQLSWWGESQLRGEVPGSWWAASWAGLERFLTRTSGQWGLVVASPSLQGFQPQEDNALIPGVTQWLSLLWAGGWSKDLPRSLLNCYVLWWSNVLSSRRTPEYWKGFLERWIK